MENTVWNNLVNAGDSSTGLVMDLKLGKFVFILAWCLVEVAILVTGICLTRRRYWTQPKLLMYWHLFVFLGGLVLLLAHLLVAQPIWLHEQDVGIARTPLDDLLDPVLVTAAVIDLLQIAYAAYQIAFVDLVQLFCARPVEPPQENLEMWVF